MINQKNLPPLNSLRMFEVAARHLNFRTAAEELHVTQGAVGQQIKRLEKFLDIKLFERLPRGLALTEEGAKYVPTVRRALEMIADATENLSQKKTVISLSLTPSFATKWFLPRLNRFTEEHPELDVKILATESLADFTRESIDIAVRQGKPPFGSSMQEHFLLPIDQIVVCSPEYARQHFKTGCIDELNDLVFIHDAHNVWKDFLEEFDPPKSVNSSKTMKFNQTALAIEAAISSQGVALVNKALAEEDIQSNKLVAPLDISLKSENAFYIVAPKSPKKADATRKTINWLLKQTLD